MKLIVSIVSIGLILLSAQSNAQNVGNFYGSTDGSESVDLLLGKNGSGSSFKILTSDPGGSCYLQMHARRYGSGFTWSRESSGGIDRKLAYMYGAISGTYYQLFDHAQTSKIQFHSNGVSYLNGGNVGIGTTTPDGLINIVGTSSGNQVKVHLANKSLDGYSVIRLGDTGTGNGKAYLHRFNSNWTSSSLMWEASSVGFYESVGSMNIGGKSAFKVFTGDINSEKFRITEQGDVGVGTTSPGAKLHIKDGGFRHGGTGEINIDAPSIIGGRLKVLDNGNVGIGTTSPSNKLDVAGTIRAEEVKVETGWADYVFAEDYDLRSLSEVSTYIQENHHLPGIPTAKEVEKDGIKLGEMNAKLLEKIEELTLYLIEMKEENNKMKYEINSQKSLNEKLIQRIEKIENL